MASLTSLKLSDDCLSGTIPFELGNLQFLEHLVLSINSLSGSIPNELGNLESLEYLGLNSNSLSGAIPCELGNLQSIAYLYLNANSLSGTIPTELETAQTLLYLDLNTNSLSGTIPSGLGNLELLVNLGLSTNHFFGTIPSELGKLQFLVYFYLNSNSLSGIIPIELGDLESLVYLICYDNSLSGAIPSELGHLQSLEYLSLFTNRLSGTIPSELGNLQYLVYLVVYDNHLLGTISSELGNLEFLEDLVLYNNSMSGTIPGSLGNLKSLEYLDVGANTLNGTIPSELGNLQSLLYLYLDTNTLSGTIPNSLGNLESMKVLSLFSNSLTGMVSNELKNLSSLVVLWLNSNKLTGVVNDLFDDMLLLSSLRLSDNLFSGSLLDELVYLKRLSYLSVNHNLFTGTIPMWVNASFLQQLDLSGNFFSGEISGLTNLLYLNQVFAGQNLLSGSIPESTLGLLLENLDLSDNLLSGSIGLWLSNSSHLRNVALGGNALSGTIPCYLGLLPVLVALNLSNNELSGDLFGFSLANSSLRSLDASSNRLSGVLPSHLFAMISLQDVLLNNNCFSGSLPETMCSNSALQYLVMNDLTSNCGSGIPKSLRPIFRGAVSQRLMSGSIPRCIWEMSGLRLLQLSGNGLTGSIGESQSANCGYSLISLLLSGNRLTGTIPEWIQTSSILQQLDLSQNHFSGTLMPSLIITSANSLFRVSVNRVSGDLPGALFLASPNVTLDVLNGNQFSCSSSGGGLGWGSVLFPSNLPPSDANRDTYICGSSFFDDYLLFALVCFFVLVLVVAFLRLMIHANYGIKSFHEFLWNGWITLLVLCLLLFILFVSLHSPTLAQFNTHSKQYLWMTTAAFLRGWAPVFVILLAFGAGEVVIAMTTTFGSMNVVAIDTKTLFLPARLQWFREILPYSFVHILNIVAVIATNSAYVYATVNGIPFDQLFVIQLSLGCFKLVWYGIAIPWFLRFLTSENRLTAHRILMSLFAFIGGPLISTFFTASDCFLYLLTPQSSVTSTIIVPKYTCSPSCITDCYDDDCKIVCSSVCRFQQMGVPTTSSPSWIYSYQCSSALLLNYVPVVIASMAISGFLLPCFIMSQFAYKGRVMLSSLARLTLRSMLIGDSFDVMRLGRFVQLKTLVNLTTMLTFGFACPLLGVLVVLDNMVWSWMRKVLIIRQIEYVKSNNVSASADQLELALKDSTSFESSHTLIVSFFVGVFWSLFVFDMIGDVYGDLTGGLCILASVVLSAVIWLAMRYRSIADNARVSQSVDRTTSPGVELSDLFLENPLQRVEEQD